MVEGRAGLTIETDLPSKACAEGSEDTAAGVAGSACSKNAVNDTRHS